MLYELDKKIADRLMKTKGEARGVVFKTDESFIVFKGGQEKVSEVESEIKKLGYSLKYSEVKSMDFYPIGLRVLSLLAIAKVFKMEEGQIKEMGSSAPKMSLIVKFFAQHFLSVKKTFDQVSQIWKKHYTVGQLVPLKVDEKKKHLTLKLEDFDIHPIMCIYLSGYFSKISEIVVKVKVEIKENEYAFDGGSSHIFEIKW